MGVRLVLMYEGERRLRWSRLLGLRLAESRLGDARLDEARLDEARLGEARLGERRFECDFERSRCLDDERREPCCREGERRPCLRGDDERRRLAGVCLGLSFRFLLSGFADCHTRVRSKRGDLECERRTAFTGDLLFALESRRLLLDLAGE